MRCDGGGLNDRHCVGRMALLHSSDPTNEDIRRHSNAARSNLLTGCSRLAGPAAGGSHDDVETDALAKFPVAAEGTISHTPELTRRLSQCLFIRGRI